MLSPQLKEIYGFSDSSVYFLKQVKDRLHRIKCNERYFNKDGIPSSHGTVPEAGKLKRLELSAINSFNGYKTGFGVGNVHEVERLSKVVT